MSKSSTDTSKPKTADANGDGPNLDRQYGDIGISAVAAALPYVGEAKNAMQRDPERHRGSRKRSVLAV